MLDRMELYLYLSRRPLYRFPPSGIGRKWKPLAKAELVEHAGKMRRSFGGGKGHVFIHFCFRCPNCGKVSMFERPNAFWDEYRCEACGGVGAFESGWYYLTINQWSFRRYNVVRGIGNAARLP